MSSWLSFVHPVSLPPWLLHPWALAWTLEWQGQRVAAITWQVILCSWCLVFIYDLCSLVDVDVRYKDTYTLYPIPKVHPKASCSDVLSLLSQYHSFDASHLLSHLLWTWVYVHIHFFLHPKYCLKLCPQGQFPCPSVSQGYCWMDLHFLNGPFSVCTYISSWFLHGKAQSLFSFSIC